MNKAKLSWFWDSGESIDSDYQAILDRATALGYTHPSPGVQTKQNAFLLALKAAGAWSYLDILYVMAQDGSKEFATLNWKSPTTFRCTFTGTITLTSNVGLYRNNGSGNYVNTNFKPQTNGVQGTLTDMSMIVGVEEMTGSSTAHFAGSDSNNDTLRYGATTTIYELNNSSGISVASKVSGLHHVQYTGGNLRLLRDAVQIDSDALATAAISNLNTLLLGDGNVAAVDAKMSIFGRGASLAGLESLVYTAWNTYKSSL